MSFQVLFMIFVTSKLNTVKKKTVYIDDACEKKAILLQSAVLNKYANELG